MIDTLAGEWPSTTNYLYATYRADADDVTSVPPGSVLVLGAGPYRIGSSVEFDWSTMNLVEGLKAEGIPAVALLNSNPETVSTDYDRSDRLYFEEITLERVRDLFDFERFRGVVTCVGSQLAQNLTPLLHMCGNPYPRNHPGVDRHGRGSRTVCALVGTAPDSATGVARVHDPRGSRDVRGRGRIPGPRATLVRAQWTSNAGDRGASRPRAVSGRSGARVAGASGGHHEVHRRRGRTRARRDLRLDAHPRGGNLGTCRTSGRPLGGRDLLSSAPDASREVQDQLIDAAERLARALEIRGPFNVQFLVKDHAYQIIELNLRASRSLPFLTKATGVPLLREAARAMLGRPLSRHGLAPLPPNQWGVKVPQFSFLQLTGSDPLLGVEMQSTGEVACFGPTFADALVKALVASGVRLVPRHGRAFLSVGGTRLKQEILPGGGPAPIAGLLLIGHRRHRSLPCLPRIRSRPSAAQSQRTRSAPEHSRSAGARADRPDAERSLFVDPREARADVRGRVHPPPEGASSSGSRYSPVSKRFSPTSRAFNGSRNIRSRSNPGMGRPSRPVDRRSRPRGRPPCSRLAVAALQRVGWPSKPRRDVGPCCSYGPGVRETW